MRKLIIAALLLAPWLMWAADDAGDADNAQLINSARAVLNDYKLFRRYSDSKFTNETRLAEINDRVGDDDVSQDEMVSLRHEIWSLNEADFNLNTVRKGMRDHLAQSIKAYKEAREVSKTDPTLKLPKGSEALLIKTELVCQNPDSLTLDIALPTDKPARAKPKETPTQAAVPPSAPAPATRPAPAPTPATPAVPATPPATTNTTPPATTPATPAAPAKPMDAAALSKFETILVGRVHGIVVRRDAAANDENKFNIVVDVKEMLRGKPIPGDAVSIYVHSPSDVFGLYKDVDELKNKLCVFALNMKDGVVTDSASPFPLQKFEKDDVEALRKTVKR
jgi:hypothetical protein